MNILDHLDAIATVTFRAASQLPVPRRVQTLVRNQPGYVCGYEMCIAKTTAGHYRLYARVNAQWMDASLADIA